MTTEPTNADRAAWAKEALAVFTVRTCKGDHPDLMDRGDLEAAIGDLIADLLHYASLQGFDPGHLILQGCYHFGTELREEC